MRVTVNGESHEVAAATLGELLAELGFEGGWLATAVNSEVVHRDDRSACPLTEGDRIEILSPMKGG